jgi:hypothetical protein
MLTETHGKKTAPILAAKDEVKLLLCSRLFWLLRWYFGFELQLLKVL